MATRDSSLLLRFLTSLPIIISGHARLLVILAIKDLKLVGAYPVLQRPWRFGTLLVLAIMSAALVLGVMDKANRLGLAHLAFGLRFTEIFDIDAVPPLVRHASYRPLTSSMGDQSFFA